MGEVARRRLALVGALALVGLLAGLSIRVQPVSDVWFYIVVGAQALVALLVARLAARAGDRVAMGLVVATAVALRAWFVLEPPTLSTDVYRYVWDGRIVDAGFNPYLHVPADPVLEPLRDPAQYEHIDKRDYAVTIYPPVAEALFALVTRVSGTVFAMKLAMVLLEGVAMLAVARMMRALARPPGWLAAYLLHPAAIWEVAGSGHVDGAMLAFAFGALAWGGGASRPYAAAAVVTLGTLVKPVAALMLPSLWRPWRVALPVFVVALAAACYLPFLSAGAGVFGFLPGYAREQGLDNGDGFLALALLRRLGLFQPWMVRAYLVGGALALVGAALWARRRGGVGLEGALRCAALLIVIFTLFLTPVYPWYFLIAGPFAPLLGLWSPFVMMTAGFLLYTVQPDTPEFFIRWCLWMGLVVAAASRDLLTAKPGADP